jgi:lantibiotic biosynthesis protein
MYAGVQILSTVCAGLDSLAEELRKSLSCAANDGLWRTDGVAWEDYDLAFGPAGVILALGTDRGCPPEYVRPAARHLALLCQRDDLDGLRIGRYHGDERRAWDYGRINTGLAHGITGVAAALCAASETSAALREELSAPLQRLCRWLVAASYIDPRGLRAWDPAHCGQRQDASVARRRQAWCYGTPGVAWTLWEAARVLQEPPLQDFAEDAMRSFCSAFDESFYIDPDPIHDALPICHGAAGTLAIADAFLLHAGLLEASTVCNRLEAYLLAHIDDIRSLAQKNMTLLTGASGALAVLLTRYGARRDWMSQIALR